MLTITIETKDEQRHEYDFADSGLEFTETMHEIAHRFEPDEVARVVVVYDDGSDVTDGTSELGSFIRPQFFAFEKFIDAARRWNF